jgi:hypothetical protein
VQYYGICSLSFEDLVLNRRRQDGFVTAVACLLRLEVIVAALTSLNAFSNLDPMDSQFVRCSMLHSQFLRKLLRDWVSIRFEQVESKSTPLRVSSIPC